MLEFLANERNLDLVMPDRVSNLCASHCSCNAQREDDGCYVCRLVGQHYMLQALKAS